jgi:peptidoglycan/LPS O-acetylase OafA/YrhL
MSFSIYLVHLPIMGTFSGFMFIMLHRSMEDSAAFAVTFVSSLVLILIVSFIMNKFVDEKGIRLTQLIYKFFDDKILKRFRHLIPPGIISGSPK